MCSKAKLIPWDLYNRFIQCKNIYKNEVDSYDIAFVKMWIDNMITEYRITNGLEAQVEMENLNTTYDFCNASEYQALPKSQ